MTGRRAATALRGFWGHLGLRGQLVAVNILVTAATVATILLLMDHIGQSSFSSIMDAAGRPVDMAAGQQAYDAAVGAEVYPAIAAGVAVALLLNFVMVTLAVRPLRAVRAATAQIAAGSEPPPIATARRDEIGDVAASVNELAQSLKRLEDLRRQVTNDVAHELRTPLHNLLGLLEGMRDGVLPASPEQLERAHGELRRLIALVEDLRALADAQLARDRMERHPVDLAVLVRDTTASFGGAMAERRLTWRVESRSDRPVVNGDRVRLAQVIGNMVDNAIRHASPGTAVTALVAPSGDSRVRVAIRDRGDTIPAEALPFVFERFFRADPSRARHRGGAGIGLAIARELVDAHGGRVGASSDAQGATFWFELPLAAPDQRPAGQQPSGAPAHPERGAEARPAPAR